MEILRQDQDPRWKKGKCVSIVQIFGDLLWQQCRDRMRMAEIQGVSDPMTIVYPNSGFSRQHLEISAIEPDPLLSRRENDSNESNPSQEDHSSGIVEKETSEVEGDPCEGDEHLKSSGDEEVGEDPPTSSCQQIPFETMDSLLMICLLRTLKYLIKDKDLPMLTSAFWSVVTRSVLCTPSP